MTKFAIRHWRPIDLTAAHHYTAGCDRLLEVQQIQCSAWKL